MSEGGARGPSPPKPAFGAAGKAATPPTPAVTPVTPVRVTPPVAARIAPRTGVMPARVSPQTHTVPTKTRAPEQPPSPPLAPLVDESWEAEPTRVEDPAPRAGSADEATRVMVRAAVDEALAPMQIILRELARRLEDLERRPSPTEPAPTPSPAPVVAQSATPPAVLPAPPAAPPPPVQAQPSPQFVLSRAAVAPALVAPAPPVHVAAAPQVWSAPRPATPLGPTLDIAAIERAAAADFDTPFDGRRRRRRVVAVLVLMVVLCVGAIVAMLARSYTRLSGIHEGELIPLAVYVHRPQSPARALRLA